MSDFIGKINFRNVLRNISAKQEGKFGNLLGKILSFQKTLTWMEEEPCSVSMRHSSQAKSECLPPDLSTAVQKRMVLSVVAVTSRYGARHAG